jgi:hypothetical protein
MEPTNIKIMDMNVYVRVGKLLLSLIKNKYYWLFEGK